ncbi:MAG: hypothetical protein ACK2VD_22715 [Anaerolineae bacterium]|jgi:hypothetical protein
MARWTRPTLNTEFHIDFDWWEQDNRDLRVHLYQHLCSECRDVYTSHLGSETVDWIDPETAEVKAVDGLWHALRTHCSIRPDYITDATPLTDAVFRTFLANGNEPLTSVELGAALNRQPSVILRVLGTGRVYDGIRPVPPGGERKRKR